MQLTVLSQRHHEGGRSLAIERGTHLEPLVLQDLLDGNVWVAGLVEESCLEDDTEGAVSYDLAIRIGEVLLIPALAVGGDNLDDLAGIIDG